MCAVVSALLSSPCAAPRPSAEALVRDGADLLRVIMLLCYYVPSPWDEPQVNMSPVNIQKLEEKKAVYHNYST